jgi:transcription elongation factor GreA
MIKYLTKQGLEKLKKELDYLDKVGRKEVSEKLEEAIAQGDLSENAGYDAAKEKQGFIERRIKELRETIAQAKIIKKEKGDKVQIGSLVFLKSKEQEEKFQLVGPEESNILEGKISFESPLGSSILGKKQGDVLKIDTPEGKKEYKIIKIN